MADNRIIEFEEEGVKFILPQDLNNVHVRREQPTPVIGDQRGREVIRVSFFDDPAAKDPSERHEFTLIVYYTYDDAVRAKKIRAENILSKKVPKDEAYLDKPFILIYDYAANKWYEPHLQGKIIYQAVSGSRKWVGSMMVKMKKWDDPLISVGP